MNGSNRFSSRQKTQEQQQALAQQHTGQESVLEFATAEAMLRHDALHTPVPPHIAHRLQTSLAQLPPPSRPWWRRWLRL